MRRRASDPQHRINIIFILCLVEKNVDYMISLVVFAAVVLVCSFFGSFVNFIILCFAVRYAVKKYVVVAVAAFYLVLVLVAVWVYNLYVFAILLFFTAWLPQAAVALHGSQVPLISTTDLQSARPL